MKRSVQAEGALSCEKCENPISPYQKYAKCSCRGTKPYTLCYGCFQKLVEEKGTKLATCHHSTGGDNGLVVVKPKNKHVYIFLDNSNFWIEGKKLNARKRNLASNEDPSLRLDIDKLTNKVAGDRGVARKFLYGSQHTDSRPNSTWTKFKERGWTCKVVKRKRNGEKGVDQQLVADLTELVPEVHFEMGTAVILCGDGDVMPAVEVCMKNHWKCEVVMWRDAVSGTLYKCADNFPQLLQVIHADQFIEEISYTDCDFDLKKLKDMAHLKSQAAVLLKIDFCPDKSWIRRMTKDLRWPFERCLFGDDKQHLLLVLVSCQNREKGKGNAKEYFDEFLSILRKKYGDKAQSYVQYDQEKRNPSRKELSFTCKNRFKVLQDELPRRLTELKQSKDDSFSLRDKQSSPVFPSLRSSICSSSTSSLTSGFQSIESPFTLSRSTSRASLASSGYEGFLDDQDNKTQVVEDGKRFQTVVPRMRMVKRRTKEMCKNKGRCTFGLRGKCHFSHTEDEIKFFKNQKKDKRCWHDNCKDRRCPYAHAPEDSFCRQCSKWGHLESESCTQRKW